MKRVNIGGQAVIEGVMMKNKDTYAVAVRKPDQEIVIEKKKFVSKSEQWKLFKLPIFRGMLAFVESMILGINILTFSASFFEVEEEVKPSKADKMIENIFKDKTEKVLIGFSVVVAILMAVGLFMILPFVLTGFLKNVVTSNLVRTIIEGAVRILLFLGYILLISRMKDIQRVFEYHGAEHKTINCLEHEEPLTVENVMKHSRLHKRCGTSFLLLVMIVSVIVFMFVKTDNVGIRILSRVVLVPIIAGISYELIRWAGSSDSLLVRIISYPGICLQRFTTREPDESQIEVAICSVKEVYNEYEKENVVDSLNDVTASS